jgi:putative pyruvate formate lyase activating enzyme
MEYFKLYKNCTLCPKACKVDRTDSEGESGPGFCKEKDNARISYIGPHFGEEPPLSGKNGSGTIFFSGCSLRCSFCQNYQISQGGMGIVMGLEDLLLKIEAMIEIHKVHNINFVTPDHFFPHVFSLVALLRKRGGTIPIVYNLSGYQSLNILRLAENFADIYLPDFKYSDSNLANRLSSCPDYPRASISAIVEMVRQKGFLDTRSKTGTLAKKGVLVRHLILPGHVENSINALNTLFIEFGSELPLSLMSQYYPTKNMKNGALNRTLTADEFKRVYDHCVDLGFEALFVQFPEKSQQSERQRPPFFPDFSLAQPFRQF